MTFTFFYSRFILCISSDWRFQRWVIFFISNSWFVWWFNSALKSDSKPQQSYSLCCLKREIIKTINTGVSEKTKPPLIDDWFKFGFICRRNTKDIQRLTRVGSSIHATDGSFDFLSVALISVEHCPLFIPISHNFPNRRILRGIFNKRAVCWVPVRGLKEERTLESTV